MAATVPVLGLSPYLGAITPAQAQAASDGLKWRHALATFGDVKYPAGFKSYDYVIVGAGSDLGGGASIMGTLCGGGTEVISIGKRCLLGANAGIGISLGDDCVVEAGLYLTAGARVLLPDGEVVKARELSGASGVLFRRNSQTGAIEVVQRSGSWGGLNAALHANQ